MERKKQNKIKEKEIQEEAIQWARFLYSAYRKKKDNLHRDIKKV